MPRWWNGIHATLKMLWPKALWVRVPPWAPRRKSQCLAARNAPLGDQIVRIFRGKKKFPIPQNMVRADVFKKCWQFGKVICLNEICGLVKEFYNPPSRFEPRQTLCLKVSDFFSERHFFGNQTLFFGGVFW